MKTNVDFRKNSTKGNSRRGIAKLVSSLVIAACAAVANVGAARADKPVLFKGVWITDAKMAPLVPKPVYARQLEKRRLPPPDPKVRNEHILFRKAFELGAVGRAVVRITADDYYKLYVNGAFVGQGPAAGTPDYTYCNTIDVTRHLKPGRNVLAVHTYYQGLVNRVWMSGDNRHGLLLDLVADGKTVVASDETFLTARHGAYLALHTVGYDTQFMERYDAGAKEVGFMRPDFDDSGWAKAVRHPLGGDYRVYEQPTPMLAFETIRPVKSEPLPNGGLRLDFGGIYVGALTFAAKGPKGAEIAILCGQELLADGSVRHKLRANCDYSEKFVLSGNGFDTLEPFDYKSFRYAEVRPPAGVEIDPKSVRFVARHMPFELKARKTFDDPRLEPIWKLCVDSFRYGVQEQIQDCMDREKGYYLGDGCYTMITYCRLTQDWSWARRFVDDFLRTAKVDRGLVTCANCSFMQEIAEYPFMFVWFVKTYLEETGDVTFVRDRYAQLADILDSYRERYARADGLLQNLDKWCVVEWPKNFQDDYDADVREGKVCTDLHNAINAWYIGAVKCLNAIAEKVGERPCADAAALERSFRQVFYDRDRHLFVDRDGSRHVSLPGNVYATFFGLEPQDDAAAHHAAFTALVRERNFAAISMFQFFPLFAWLRASGEEALLKGLMLSPEAWQRNLREGATRTFEGWGRDTKWNTSLFHLTIASLAWFLCDAPAEPHVDGIVAELRDCVAKLRAADPEAVPMAFWDFDGTIIKGDVGLGYHDGTGGYDGIARETILAGFAPFYRGEEGHRRWLKDYDYMCKVGRWLSQAYDVQMYHGADARQLDAFCSRRYAEMRVSDWYFASSMAIWRALERLGVENHVVSANVEPVVRSLAPTLGIPRERFRATRVAIEGGRLTTRVLEPVPFGEGKVDAVRGIVGARPHGVAIAGFGNSYSTDAPFLRYIVTQPLPGGAKPLAMMINGGPERAAYKGLFHLAEQTMTVRESRAFSSPKSTEAARR